MKSIFVFSRPYFEVSVIAENKEKARKMEEIEKDMKLVKVIENCVTEKTENQIITWYME